MKPADIAAAWREIQRLPATAALGHALSADASDTESEADDGRERDAVGGVAEDGFATFEPGPDRSAGAAIEFGPLDESEGRTFADIGEVVRGFDHAPAPAVADPWRGPDVEFVFDAASDPFQEFFEQEERIVERYLLRSPDDFSRYQHVASDAGAAIVRQLAELGDDEPHLGGGPPGPAARVRQSVEPTSPVMVQDGAREGDDRGGDADEDDADMVVIEEDLLAASCSRPAVAAVRLGDYRRLFARLRRGG